MSWAIGLKLNTRDKFVLLMLANYASNDSGDCYPSLARLEADTGMTRHTVIEAIKALEAAGALAVIRRQQNGVSLPNTYRLNLAWGGSAAAAPVVHLTPGGSAAIAPKPINEPINEKKEERERVTFQESNYRFEIPAPILASWLEAYPGLDVHQEIAKAESWLAVNPTRRPKRDFGRFLNGWLNRAANDRRPTATPKTKQDRREAFMEGLFGPQEVRHVVDVAATVLN